jgi:hypothetical protein
MTEGRRERREDFKRRIEGSCVCGLTAYQQDSAHFNFFRRGIIVEKFLFFLCLFFLFDFFMQFLAAAAAAAAG